MSTTLFKEYGHLTKTSLKALKEGSLNDNELILLSEHICNCEGCADALANSFNDNELVEAPLGFEQEVFYKVKKKKENNTQFVFYSLRVVMAASVALMIVFSNGLNFLANTETKTLKVNPMSLSTINTINESLNDFSQKIINLEVFNNEKGKK
ncbi:hypothetical protein K9O30_14080 [Clostridium bowmanii]|uniref:hypothetical protein n=1 Tax=Clostridium bowmanii TaxID=132925 RepID=UPI001C0DF91C|nr:hypothetical protein [Clostridium bowmanii]MBU3190197.1 hypothetical protein [Clostridium bowmanii]MCA1074828.1 hypothetical protein [Clostridium bowmanii]